jgi:hypothetical protein
MRLGILADHTFLLDILPGIPFSLDMPFVPWRIDRQYHHQKRSHPLSNEPIIIILCLPFANFDNTIITLGVAQRCQDSVHGLESVVRS